MYTPKVEIKSVNTDGTILTEIYVDGNKIPGVRNYKLTQQAGEVPILTFDISALNISIDTFSQLRQVGVQSNIKEIIFEKPYA